ncbi:MAG: hypothetical protein EHM85_16800 [Desulfobacteraceae bacterium]|nr:MAG: hypothetical protein EHM85_16800 [Desulfobacteraceae bacterium]
MEKISAVRLNGTNELIIISNESLNGEYSSGHLHQVQPKIDLSEFNSPISTQGDSLSPLCGTEAVLDEGPGGHNPGKVGSVKAMIDISHNIAPRPCLSDDAYQYLTIFGMT